jgi:predicted small lipoprotein YifL
MRRIKTQCLLLTLVLLLGGGMTLSGCGKKGPLYLPDKTPAPAAKP